MNGATPTGDAPFASLGVRDLVALAAWDLLDAGDEIKARSLLRAAATIERDLWDVAGSRAVAVRALVDCLPLRTPLRMAILHRLH
jgi:hypothetical protein